ADTAAREQSISSPIGKILAAVGSFTITRAGAAVGSSGVGELLYQGDRIETGVDGEVALLFLDGATFQLFAGTQVVLDEFIYADENSSNSAALRVAKGKFGFIA